MLPQPLKDPLTQHLAKVRDVYEQDLAACQANVLLPDALARKYPNAPPRVGLAVGLPRPRPLH